MNDNHGMEWCHLKITRLEDEYAKLWQMYGDLEAERDRLRCVFMDIRDELQPLAERNGGMWRYIYNRVRAALQKVEG